MARVALVPTEQVVPVELVVEVVADKPVLSVMTVPVTVAAAAAAAVREVPVDSVVLAVVLLLVYIYLTMDPAEILFNPELLQEQLVRVVMVVMVVPVVQAEPEEMDLEPVPVR